MTAWLALPDAPHPPYHLHVQQLRSKTSRFAQKCQPNPTAHCLRAALADSQLTQPPQCEHTSQRAAQPPARSVLVSPVCALRGSIIASSWSTRSAFLMQFNCDSGRCTQAMHTRHNHNHNSGSCTQATGMGTRPVAHQGGSLLEPTIADPARNLCSFVDQARTHL